eukprot:CAMPEP_0115723790 /NCGR_PEP_ID=MMETSP0272-20121206/80429_1 /TAXON_ID=71861 /ORGANISM="Scrippsiella trochoidea, Strain CCMP3099" /LENGTH=69 /DNA_ID=CAMNT_0003166963 /DNA_START=187 /DNA_END=394 /DNA_ORIENTATION=-
MASGRAQGVREVQAPLLGLARVMSAIAAAAAGLGALLGYSGTPAFIASGPWRGAIAGGSLRGAAESGVV